MFVENVSHEKHWNVIMCLFSDKQSLAINTVFRMGDSFPNTTMYKINEPREHGIAGINRNPLRLALTYRPSSHKKKKER